MSSTHNLQYKQVLHVDLAGTGHTPRNTVSRDAVEMREVGCCKPLHSLGGVQPVWYTFAKKPPVIKSRKQQHAGKPGTPQAAFAMNPNTGALIPVNQAVAHKSSHSPTLASPLLSTPMHHGPPMSWGRAGASRSTAPSSSQPAAVADVVPPPAQLPISPSLTPLKVQVAAETPSQAEPAAGLAAPPHDSSDDSEPPSPKWDETTGFFTKPRRPHLRRSAHRTPVHTPARPGPRTPPSTEIRAGDVSAEANVGPQATEDPSVAPAGGAPRPSISGMSGPTGGSAARQPRAGAAFRTAVPSKGHQLTILSIEIIASCRGKLLPDPQHDAVLVVAMTVWYDHEDVRQNLFETRLLMSTPTAAGPAARPIPHLPSAAVGAQVDVLPDEAALLKEVLAAVTALDPDLIVAFDIMRGSVGYLEARARAIALPGSFLRQLGRCPEHPGALLLHFTTLRAGGSCCAVVSLVTAAQLVTAAHTRC